MKRVLIFGHRGAAGYKLENTRESFDHAMAQGADGLECDLRLTADDRLVVFHDDSLSRLAGDRRRIKELTFEQLSRVVLAKKIKGKTHHAPIALPEDVIEAAGERGLINLELKPAGDEKLLAEKTYRLIKKHRLQDRVIVSSFSGAALLEFSRLGGKIKLGALAEGWPPGYIEVAAEFGAYSINPFYREITAARVAAAHDRGLKVIPYTVNRVPSLERVITRGVDGMFSDYPDRALEVVNRCRR
jgi:glycerophosphoryl diester phosphodiesterase